MILKTTFKDGQVFFEDLGDKFTITSKQRSPNKFDTLMRGNKWESEECYAIISSLRMETVDIPIYPDYYYSILSERGCEVMKIRINNL